MELRVIVGGASEELGAAICRSLGIERVTYLRGDYPDGELAPVVCGPLRGDDCYIVQSTAPPVERNVMELLLLADACRREGASRVTAVVPYFGYARQDRRVAPGTALGAAVLGGMLESVGIDRVAVVDPHTPALEAIVGLPLDRLSAVHSLAGHLALGDDGVSDDGAHDGGAHDGGANVVVAPDLGAVKLAHRYARELGVPTAVVHKERLSGDAVRTHAVIGDVAGRSAVIVDDMLSTAGTVVAAAQALRDAGASGRTLVVVTHGLFREPSPRRLRELGAERVLTTDTVAADDPPGVRVERVSIAEPLAAFVRAQYEGRPFHDAASYD
jgi:ribose-phosphate pyrophosphokinase